MRRFLVLVTVAALLLVSAVSFAAAPTAKSGGGRFFEAVQMPDEALAALKASGKPLPFSQFPYNTRANGVPYKSQGTVDSYSLFAGPAAAEQKVLAILVSFADDPPGGPSTRVDPATFDALIEGTTYNPYSQAVLDKYAGQGHPVPLDRTVNNFYKEASFGAVTVTTGTVKPSVVGWVQVPHPYSYYSVGDGIHDNGFGPYPNNAQGLVVDALTVAAAKGIDFSSYADPKTGIVPNIFIIHAGSGAEWSGTPDLIWSHSWSLSDDPKWGALGKTLTIGGATFDKYAMEPEVGGDLTAYLGSVSGPFPATVGVFAHEFGHVLGMPDLYDIFYNSEGAGNYTLMSGGSWMRYPNALLFNGNSPAELDPWNKIQLGFLKQGVNLQTIGGPGHYKLYPANTASPGVKALRYNVPGSNGTEYFLLENRQQVGFDRGLARNGAVAGSYSASHGLLVWHVDDTINAYTDIYGPLDPNISNEPNVSPKWSESAFNAGLTGPNGFDHYGVAVIQADDQFDLEHARNRGDAADFFPGTTGNRSLTFNTTPNTSSFYFWNGEPQPGDSGLAIKNIVENADGSVEFDIK